MKSTPISVTVIGNGKSEKQRYLFNMPEGILREFMEYKLKLPSLKQIFLTSTDWSCCGGYPDALHACYYSPFTYIPIHAPSNFEKMMLDSNLIWQLKNEITERWTTDDHIVKDSNFTFVPIPITQNNITTISYHCGCPEFLGKFDNAKAEKLKIPGAQRGKLMRGETITLPDGKVVTQSDVCGKPINPGYIIVLHFPTIAHCNEYLQLHQIQNVVCCICAIVSAEVKSSPQFQSFIQLHNCITLITEDRITNITTTITHTNFHLSYEMQQALNKILPAFSPQYPTNLLPTYKASNNQLIFEDAPSLHAFTIFPKRTTIALQKTNTFIIPNIPPLQIQPNKIFEVRLVGTGGAVPGKVRNVSASLLRYNNKTILIDCGEATAFHLQEYGINVDDIDLIYLTHGHADHINGLMSLLHMRKKKALVVGPRSMTSGFSVLCETNQVSMEYIANDLFALENGIGTEQQQVLKLIEDTIGAQFRTKLLNHSLPNYAIKIMTNNFSIVFTGDTCPTPEEAIFCNGVDVVVHECNFEDGMESEAEARKHSTPNQIEQCLKDSKNKVIVLNHIGQRTTKFGDIVKKDYQVNMVYGFDGMVFGEQLYNVQNEYKKALAEFYSLNEIDENEE
ncbi:ribonuclease Z [Entamoeba marina]